VPLVEAACPICYGRLGVACNRAVRCAVCLRSCHRRCCVLTEPGTPSASAAAPGAGWVGVRGGARRRRFVCEGTRRFCVSWFDCLGSLRPERFGRTRTMRGRLPHQRAVSTVHGVSYVLLVRFCLRFPLRDCVDTTTRFMERHILKVRPAPASLFVAHSHRCSDMEFLL
jgi:hypothetical protein